MQGCLTQFLAAILVLAGTCATQGADATVKPLVVTTPGNEPRQQLRYQFQPGQFVHYEVVSKTTMRSQFQQQVETVQNEAQSWKQFRVISVDEQGMALLEPVVDRTKMSVQYNEDAPIKWDSQSPVDQDPSQFHPIRQTIGKPIARIQVTPNGQMQKVTILDGAPTRLAGAEASDARLNFLVPLPQELVGVGAIWREQFQVTVTAQGLPSQKVTLQRQYQLINITGNIATISLKTQVNQPIDNPQIQLQLLNLTPTGTVEFDMARGHLLSQKIGDSDQIVGALGPQTVVKSSMETSETWMPSPVGVQPARLETTTTK